MECAVLSALLELFFYAVYAAYEMQTLIAILESNVKEIYDIIKTHWPCLLQTQGYDGKLLDHLARKCFKDFLQNVTMYVHLNQRINSESFVNDILRRYPFEH